jgi:hypothetical protein
MLMNDFEHTKYLKLFSLKKIHFFNRIVEIGSNNILEEIKNNAFIYASVIICKNHFYILI